MKTLKYCISKDLPVIAEPEVLVVSGAAGITGVTVTVEQPTGR